MDEHYTCTGNKKYGSGNGSGGAMISNKILFKKFGQYPQNNLDRIIMCERLLAMDNPQRKREQNNL